MTGEQLLYRLIMRGGQGLNSLKRRWAIKNEPVFDPAKLELFLDRINALKARGLWERDELVELFHTMIPEFGHKEMGKFLDDKM